MPNWVCIYHLIIEDWSTILPIGISIISLLVSVLSFRRTSKYQEYEYAVRLQLANARTTCNPYSLPEAVFTYDANLENRGLKPVEIARVDFACGQLFDLDRCDVKTQIGRTHLAPGTFVEINFKISGKEMIAIETKYGITECAIFLIIKYKDTRGIQREKKSLVGGFDKGNIPIFVITDGNAVT